MFQLVNPNGKINRVVVYGQNMGGELYALPVTKLSMDDYDYTVTVLVELPFEPEHRIWPELRRINDA